MTGADRMHARTFEIGVDVGGTFTDAVALGPTGLLSVKVPTTRDDHGIGVLDAIMRLIAAADVGTSEVTRIAHGMTVGTNALLEGQLAPTALVTTRGFGDVLELRRQNRADLYRLDVAHPAAVVPRGRVIEADERCGPDGILVALTDAEAERIAGEIAALGVDAVAVALLFAFRHPDHERRIADAVRRRLPEVHVSASAEVLGEIREYERTATTAVDAALTPVLRRYLSGLIGRTRAVGLPNPAVMQSNGGLIDLGLAARHASRTVLSGPAGGVTGAALWARAEGIAHALTFDMGGTSCDVALVAHGEPGRTSGTEINGHPLHLPMLDIQTVSAGGGSIAWADSGGALRVGPRSAGARPGPAAYGFGGDRPTVTDAQVVLGRVRAVGTPGAEISLDAACAAAAVARLAGELGLGVEACAEGILAVANHEMARALRVVSVERGVHPAGTVLIAFGGAGPLHACDVADLLGIERVLAPGCAGVLAALGTVVAGTRRDWARTVLLPLSDTAAVGRALADELAAARAAVAGAEIRVSADCRFVGQSHALDVPWDTEGDTATLAERFRAAHTRRYGDADPVAPIEVVTLRVAAELPGVTLEVDMTPVGPPQPGPCAVPMQGATLWVPAGWTARSGADGTYDVRRDGKAGAWIR
jgi:N-methylhydantoinase A